MNLMSIALRRPVPANVHTYHVSFCSEDSKGKRITTIKLSASSRQELQNLVDVLNIPYSKFNSCELSCSYKNGDLSAWCRLGIAELQ